MLVSGWFCGLLSCGWTAALADICCRRFWRDWSVALTGMNSYCSRDSRCICKFMLASGSFFVFCRLRMGDCFAEVISGLRDEALTAHWAYRLEWSCLLNCLTSVFVQLFFYEVGLSLLKSRWYLMF